MVLFTHKRRIKTDEKAKVVASVLGEEYIKFLAALCSCFALDDLNYRMNELHQDDLKEEDKFILFFNIVLGKIASDELRLFSCLYPSSVCVYTLQTEQCYKLYFQEECLKIRPFDNCSLLPFISSVHFRLP